MAANPAEEATQALVVIDVQLGIVRNADMHEAWPRTLANIAQLIARSHAAGQPVFFVQHDGGSGHPLEPGTSGWALCPELAVADNDVLIRKRDCDAFFGTELETTLRERGIDRVVIAGCMTEYCVDTSVRRAVSLGLNVTLAGDAHGTHNSSTLVAGQIIEHHNRVLDGFSAGRAAVTVTPSVAVAFT